MNFLKGFILKNPNNCEICDHKKRPDGGWCYMFRNEPEDVCHIHTAKFYGVGKLLFEFDEIFKNVKET